MKSKKKVQVISFQSLSANSGAGMARLGHMLSTELEKRGLLKNFIVHSKGKFDTAFLSKPVSFLSRYYLFVLNRLAKVIKIPAYKFRLMQEMLFDWFCQWRIKDNTDIIFTTNAFMYHSFKKAKKLGITIILLPGTPEENFIYHLVSDENKKMGISSTDAYTYKKRLAYFNKSIVYVDKVIGSLPTVYTSYSQSSFKGEVVKILGHMTPNFKHFTPKTGTSNNVIYIVGYIAYTVILKGLHYLLEAWQEIMEDDNNKNMVLQVAGANDDIMSQYINLHFPHLKNVKMIGHVTDVASFMQQLDLFVVPSLIDGGPVTALEAAHYAIPVIITENSGSSELLSRNNPGCKIIPIRDKNAIKENILWAYNNKEESRQMGKNAKYNMDTYSMENFIVEIANYLEHKA